MLKGPRFSLIDLAHWHVWEQHATGNAVEWLGISQVHQLIFPVEAKPFTKHTLKVFRKPRQLHEIDPYLGSPAGPMILVALPSAELIDIRFVSQWTECNCTLF